MSHMIGVGETSLRGRMTGRPVRPHQCGGAGWRYCQSGGSGGLTCVCVCVYVLVFVHQGLFERLDLV